MVIKEASESFYERLAAISDLAPDEDISIIIYTAAEFEKIKYKVFYQENVYKVGETLYDVRENWQKSFY